MYNRSFALRRLCAVTVAFVGGNLLALGSVHAASANTTVPVVLKVNAPTCTVTSGNETVYLPPASSQSITQNQWLTANAITTAGQVNSGWSTSATLNQTATIECNASTTTITGVVVQPGASAALYPGNTSIQYLVDASPTPVKASGGNLIMSFEQVAINGASTPYSYSSTTVQTYTTVFNTTSVGASSSTATVVWRPVFANNQTATAIGNPTGGSYVGSAQIVVSY